MSEIKLNGLISNYGFYQKDDYETDVKSDVQKRDNKAPDTK